MQIRLAGGLETRLIAIAVQGAGGDGCVELHGGVHAFLYEFRGIGPTAQRPAGGVVELEERALRTEYGEAGGKKDGGVQQTDADDGDDEDAQLAVEEDLRRDHQGSGGESSHG